MQKITIITLIFLLAMFFGLQVNAQKIGDLDGINYQAVAVDEEGQEIVGKDIEGKPLHEQEIGVRFTIQKGEEGAVQYQETHTTLTDKNGMFSLVIGKGEQTGNGQYGELLNIPWIDADQWLKVEISIENNSNYRLVSLQQFMTVPYSFYTDDIADNAINTDKIENGSVQNEDIQDSTIDLSAKVTDTLAVENGGTGRAYLEEDGLLIGKGSEPIKALPRLKAGQIPVGTTSEPAMKDLAGGTGIDVEQKEDSVIISSTFSGGVNADGVETIDIGTIQPGDTYTSQSFPVPGGGAVMGDIILASIDKNLKGCMLTPYLFSDNTARIAIFNGTGGSVNLGNDVTVKILIVK